MKTGQDKKQKIFSSSLSLKRQGQEEMVGFALIMIIVAVIILVFISFTLSKPPANENIESYKVSSFLQALLQHTSSCEENQGYLSIQTLIFECQNNENCLNGESSCAVLNSTLNELTNSFWSKQKGYKLAIEIDNSLFLELKKGNISSTYKGAIQSFSRSGNSIQISFRAYD